MSLRPTENIEPFLTSSAENLVEISGVEFSYGSTKVLKGLDLKIARGKLVAILGASGSGKSTLLRLIGGQAKPDRGTVKVAGQVVHELDTRALYALRRKMGMMFQAGGLFTDVSVFENIAFPMREHARLPESVLRRIVRQFGGTMALDCAVETEGVIRVGDPVTLL